MALYVQKFGGTSVGTLEKIQKVADKIHATVQAGHQVVVVVSAMSGETNRLVNLSRTISPIPDPREYAVLVTTGEQVSIALLSMALMEKGVAAQSFTGLQLPLKTNNAYEDANILSVDTSKLRQCLAAGKVAVVAGFQGRDAHANITTLGRGGSDTTAVLLASALEADACYIYTDVDGVYSADPNLVSDAYCLPQVASAHLLNLSKLGAKVMQAKAMQIAHDRDVPLHILSTFGGHPGTQVCYGDGALLGTVGIAHLMGQHLINIPSSFLREFKLADLLGALRAGRVAPDLHVRGENAAGESRVQLSFPSEQFPKVQQILEKILPKSVTNGFEVLEGRAKVSVVSHGVSTNVVEGEKVIKILTNENISVNLFNIRPQYISALVAEKDVKSGVEALHHVFCGQNMIEK